MFKRTEGTNNLSDLENKKLEIEAREFAEKIRGDLGLDDSNPIDIIALLETHGILVFQITNLGTSGFIRVLEGNKAIFLNASEPLGRQYYTAIHEYCHILRDLDRVKEIEDYTKEQKTIEFNKMERFAFKFADYFLMPERSLVHYLHLSNIKDFQSIGYKEIFGIQQYFKLSYKQVTRMLNKYDIISKEQRNELNKISSKEKPNELIDATKKAGYDTAIVCPLPESRIPARFMRCLIENIQQQRITKKKAQYLADLLRMPSLLSYVEKEGLHQ
ncbi:Zn-dependent peptidase ImmA (M78 family) [Bacillus sp. RC240]|uniref:ImmA/IrrE family metallo-endopeptidase n=1 Tax=Bacillus sp. RC240 TaxID=3156285 RepID=UPI00383539E5